MMTVLSKAVVLTVKGQLTDFRRWNCIGLGDWLVRKGESPELPSDLWCGQQQE